MRRRANESIPSDASRNFSLLMVSQLVVHTSGDLAARRRDRFDDYTEAIRTLGRDPRFPADLVRQLGKSGGS